MPDQQQQQLEVDSPTLPENKELLNELLQQSFWNISLSFYNLRVICAVKATFNYFSQLCVQMLSCSLIIICLQSSVVCLIYRLENEPLKLIGQIAAAGLLDL